MPDCLPSWKAAQELANWHRMHEKKSPVKISQAFRQLEKKGEIKVGVSLNESKEHGVRKCVDDVDAMPKTSII